MKTTIETLHKKIYIEQPLIHCITNQVVANFQANGLLALGASPVMADAVEEAAEMTSKADCTVLNIGTLKKQTVEAMLLAGKSANDCGVPVVLDPVGAGATAFRKNSVLRILDEVQLSLIRCNVGELMAIGNVNWKAKGVDSGDGDADIETVAKQVASKHQCIVAVTGSTDIVTNGVDTHFISGGDPIMTRVTGMGCLLSAVTGSFLAVAHENQLLAVASALTFYKSAGEKAASIANGTGDFAFLFLNALGKQALCTQMEGVLK